MRHKKASINRADEHDEQHRNSPIRHRAIARFSLDQLGQSVETFADENGEPYQSEEPTEEAQEDEHRVHRDDYTPSGSLALGEAQPKIRISPVEQQISGGP